jgi:hypothetical protein
LVNQSIVDLLAPLRSPLEIKSRFKRPNRSGDISCAGAAIYPTAKWLCLLTP